MDEQESADLIEDWFEEWSITMDDHRAELDIRAALGEMIEKFIDAEREACAVRLKKLKVLCVENERESCAVLCDEYARTATEAGTYTMAACARDLAAQIRARGNKDDTTASG